MSRHFGDGDHADSSVIDFRYFGGGSYPNFAKSLGDLPDNDPGYLAGSLIGGLFIPLILGITGMKMIRRPGAQPAKNEEPLDEVAWNA